MPNKRVKQINLLPLDSFEATSFGRILKWALSSFRVMVILTELVVMSAFLSRFWLDARNSDLNEMISIKQAQVRAYSPIENEFRLLQKKIDVSKALYSEQKRVDLVQSITKSLPEDVYLNSTTINDEGVQIKASSLSERSVVQFLINLESDGKFLSPAISQVSSGTDDNIAISFTINGKINTK